MNYLLNKVKKIPLRKLPARALSFFSNHILRKLSILNSNIYLAIVPKRVRLAKSIGTYKSYSQAQQDVFVLEMLEKKRGGYYVEIGAYDEIQSSNTYTLEKNYGWNGFSIEWDEHAASDFNAVRHNKCICCDATTFDYEQHFDAHSLPKQFDYLSLDIEPAFQTFEVLKRLPLNKYRFSVITYEHDMYVSGPEYMHASRKLLESFGYKLVVANVRWQGRDFEDWYVDPNVVSERIWQRYEQAEIDSLEIFSKLTVR